MNLPGLFHAEACSAWNSPGRFPDDVDSQRDYVLAEIVSTVPSVITEAVRECGRSEVWLSGSVAVL